MKILFLQNCADVYGGAEFVNQMLANEFVKDNYDVTIACKWYTGNNQYIDYDRRVNKIVVSQNVDTQMPSKKEMIKKIFGLNFKSFFKDLKQIKKHYNSIKIDNKLLMTTIKGETPDIIIASNPLLLKSVPKEMLSKTFCHMHSGFKFYLENKKITNFLFKYNKLIKGFIWIAESTVDLAKELGFNNNIYITNPIRIKCDKISNLKNKKAVFIGRISPEKRVDLLVDIFNNIKQAVPDWSLEIYGSGNINAKSKEIILTNKQIKLMGPTNNVKDVLKESSLLLITSSYEGLSMVIFEAYECGVPVLSFNFGNSVNQSIKNNITGVIINDDNKKEYENKLIELLTNYNFRKKLGENAKEYAKEYYIENIVKKWYDLFDEVNHEKN
ncbi:MAG: glycosyltransferase [Bacilli bacterium]